MFRAHSTFRFLSSRLSLPVTATLTLTAAALAAGSACAADALAPEGVVAFSSSATLQVARDLLSVSFETTREGADAAAVQAQLEQALAAGLAQARRAASPGQVDVQAGHFSIAPRYGGKGEMTGWRGSAQMVVEGRDMQAIGLLTSRITTLTIGRVGYEVSRELREKSEAEATAQAIARYRANAADYARQFGYSGYVIREVQVASNEARPPMFARVAAATMSSESLPVEAGTGTVTVNVNGTVQMTR